MRPLLIALSLALPLAASAASPAPAYDDASYTANEHTAFSLVQVQRAPNPYGDAGLNGSPEKAPVPARSASHANDQARASSDRPCSCSHS